MVLQWTNYHELSMINISPIVIYTKNTPTTCKGLTVISPKAVINHKVIVSLHVKWYHFTKNNNDFRTRFNLMLKSILNVIK